MILHTNLISRKDENREEKKTKKEEEEEEEKLNQKDTEVRKTQEEADKRKKEQQEELHNQKGEKGTDGIKIGRWKIFLNNRKLIFCILLITLVSIIGIALSLNGEPYNSSQIPEDIWNCTQEILITENSGKTLQGYPVLVSLDSSNFNFKKQKVTDQTFDSSQKMKCSITGLKLGILKMKRLLSGLSFRFSLQTRVLK